MDAEALAVLDAIRALQEERRHINGKIRRLNATLSRKKAQARGQVLGRKQSACYADVVALRAKGWSIRAIAAAVQTSTATVQRALKAAAIRAAVAAESSAS